MSWFLSIRILDLLQFKPCQPIHKVIIFCPEPELTQTYHNTPLSSEGTLQPASHFLSLLHGSTNSLSSPNPTHLDTAVLTEPLPRAAAWWDSGGDWRQ